MAFYPGGVNGAGDALAEPLRNALIDGLARAVLTRPQLARRSALEGSTFPSTLMRRSLCECPSLDEALACSSHIAETRSLVEQALHLPCSNMRSLEKNSIFCY